MNLDPTPLVARTELVKLSDVTLSVTTIGHGETGVICLHGGMGLDGSYFANSALAKLASTQLRVAWFDQRGHGLSELTGEGTYSHANWVSDVNELAEKLGFKKYTLVGHSYGGCLALEAALKRPKGLQKLIIVDSRSGPIENINYNSDVDSDSDLREHYRNFWPNFFPGDDQHWDLFERIQYRSDAYLEAFGRELASYDVSDQLVEIQIPTLLIWGDCGFYDTEMCQLANTIANSTAVRISRSGHFPFVDASQGFLAVTKDFLNAN